MGIAFNDNFGTIAYNGVFYPANSGGGIIPPVIEGKKPMPFLIKTDINAINYNCNCIISNEPIDITSPVNSTILPPAYFGISQTESPSSNSPVMWFFDFRIVPFLMYSISSSEPITR